MQISDLPPFVSRRVQIHATDVTWDEALPVLGQASFDFVVMDSWNPAFDTQRERIMAVLPNKSAILMLQRLAASKEVCKEIVFNSAESATITA